MRRMLVLPALMVALAVCVSGEKLEAPESKPVRKLNTFVVQPKHQDAVSATPVLERKQLTVSSEPPQLLGSAADEPAQSGVKLSTKTIYGFLNFVTTVGNTVMVFTPGAGTPAGAQSAEPSPASVAPSPSRTVPAIASTASEPLPERRLRFTTTEPSPSSEPDTTEPPVIGRRKGKNLLWAKLRERTPKDRRPFVLPQRRGLQIARSAAALLPTPPLERQFLSAAPASVVPEPTPTPELDTPTVSERTVAALRTVQAGEEFSDPEPTELPTEEGVTHVSSVIQGTVTEFPQLPAPAAEPEVLPIEQLFASSEPEEPAGEPDSRPPVQSLQERLKARLQAALASRPSRASAAGQRRPFTLVPEQRARAARPGRPELLLSARRSPSRSKSERRLSAADRLKQRLLKQRQESLAEEEELTQEESPELLQEPDQELGDPQPEVVAVNTYRPTDATDFHYELSTMRALHHNTLGRFTTSRWVTSTETRTVRVSPTATQRAPPVSSTALPAGATLGLFGAAGLTPSSGSGLDKVVMLPAVQLDPSSPSLPLKTMTETYRTTQLLLKSSVIPLVIGDSTRAFTLTQSYQVTRLVTALKTMPPMEVFQTAPPGLLHRERPLLAQGSENQVDELGVPVVRVPPPDDLAAIGLFDVDRHESEMNPEEFKLQQQAAAPPAPTPALPPQLGMLGALGQLGQLGALAQLSQLTPQQLAYLQLLGPIFPGLQAPHGALPATPQTIVTSSPVTYSTITTRIHSQAVVVTFRATPSTAYITSTTVFPTVLTSYVTSTMKVHPTSPLG
ncbi:uncharacterized protein LOC122389770 isoform X1 [Amphibalanus amphitrite]|uniref:uncharacterized protein LOC122389770 isoform X1 n=1 Tax=Amphibalanus amphitrite TaxID=1232801 RepID=UPI001C8FDA8F|nr:uncharacterized protein LOC122389770 isoform X1 [Amphibalanus amphitrite]